MSEKGRTEEFLDLYRKLEHIGREIYFPNSNNAPIIGRLQALPVLKEFKEEIDYCRVVRNFLVHNPKVNGAYPIAPSEEMLDVLRKCVDRISNPILAMKFAVRRENLYSATLDCKISEVAEYMDTHGFTHVPVFEKEKLVGVFSDNSIYAYVCAHKELNINVHSTLRVLEEYLALDMHTNEYFERTPSSNYWTHGRKSASATRAVERTSSLFVRYFHAKRRTPCISTRSNTRPRM